MTGRGKKEKIITNVSDTGNLTKVLQEPHQGGEGGGAAPEASQEM